jgi:O-antigen ligase
VDIDNYGITTVFRYAYWLFIFVLVVYVVSVGKFAPIMTGVFGWSILLLAMLRWTEVALYSNFGAWSGTRWLTQNAYGFQFSAFSSFLLMLTLSEKGWKRIGAFIGYGLLYGAVAINGSRGSWLAVGTGLFIFLMVLFLSNPRRFSSTVIFLLLTGSIAFVVFASSPQISEAVDRRLNTFQNLDVEKSYQVRQIMNQKSWLLFQQSPLFGVGAGRFRVSSVPLDLPSIFSYASDSYFDGKSSHNSYFGFLAENGLFGAVPFAVLLLTLIITGFKSALTLSRQSQYWGPAIYASFISMSVHMWAISSLTNTATWFIYGLVAAMIILARTWLQEPQK